MYDGEVSFSWPVHFRSGSRTCAGNCSVRWHVYPTCSLVHDKSAVGRILAADLHCSQMQHKNTSFGITSLGTNWEMVVFLLSDKECLFIKRSSQPQLALKPSSEASDLACIQIICRDTCKWQERNSTIHPNSSSSISTLSGFLPAPSSYFFMDFFFFFIAASWFFWLHHMQILLASRPNFVHPLPSKNASLVQVLLVCKKYHSFPSDCSLTSITFSPLPLHFQCGITGVTVDGAVPHMLMTRSLFLNKGRYPPLPPPLNETGLYSGRPLFEAIQYITCGCSIFGVEYESVIASTHFRRWHS